MHSTTVVVLCNQFDASLHRRNPWWYGIWPCSGLHRRHLGQVVAINFKARIPCCVLIFRDFFSAAERRCTYTQNLLEFIGSGETAPRIRAGPVSDSPLLLVFTHAFTDVAWPYFLSSYLKFLQFKHGTRGRKWIWTYKQFFVYFLRSFVVFSPNPISYFDFLGSTHTHLLFLLYFLLICTSFFSCKGVGRKYRGHFCTDWIWTITPGLFLHSFLLQPQALSRRAPHVFLRLVSSCLVRRRLALL